MANNRLVAALKEAQKRADIQEQFRRLSESPATTQTDRFDSVPVIGQASLNVEPEYSLADRFSNFSAGLGRSLGEGAVGTLNMVAHPVETARALYGAARSAVADPKATASQLADALQRDYRAMTSGDMYETGQTLGKYLSLRPKPRNVAVSELDVYHGTPHRFPATEANPLGEFDASKIGTGEGAQAYGHGIYYAENPEVAKGYQSSLSANRGFSFEGKTGLTRAEVQDMVNAKYGKKYLDNISRPSGVADSFIDDMVTGVTRAEESYPRQYKTGSERAKLYDELRGKITHASPGSLYKADLPDEMIDRMLNWDKPLSEQPDIYKKVLDDKNWRKRLEFRTDAQVGEMKGSDLYRMGHDQTKNLGIPGIKYLDQNSRGATGTGKWQLKLKDGTTKIFDFKPNDDVLEMMGATAIPIGTRNFVVFPGEEKKVKILERK